MHGGSLTFFQHRVHAIQGKAGGDGAHDFHGLADGCKRRGVKSRGGDVVKSDDGAMFGNAQPGFGEGANGTESGHVVKGNEGGEGALLFEQTFGEFEAVFETGDGITGFGKVEDEAGIDFEVAGFGKRTNSLPARSSIGQRLGAANESDLAMSQGVEMLEGSVAAEFVVDHHGADRVGLKFASDHDGGDIAFFEVGEDVDVHEKPVGEDDQGFDTAVEQHFQIALEAAAFVVDVGENGKIGRLVKRIFDATKNQSAVGIGHVEDHNADGVAALAAEGAGKEVGTVAEFLSSAFDAFFGAGGNVAGQRSIIENDGDSSGGEPALFGDIANCDHGAFHGAPDDSDYGAAASLNSCGRWRTLQQRVKPVSSSGLRVAAVVLVLASCAAGGGRLTEPGQTAACFVVIQAAKSA